MAIADLLSDPDVLQPTPTAELQGFAAIARVGGRAVLPWRGEWLRCRAAGLDAASDAAALAGESFAQCVVHLQKSRPGTWQDLATAWRHLEPAGALLLCGANALGVRSAVKRLARELNQEPEVLVNRAHGRLVRFRRDRGDGPVAPATPQVELPPGLAGDAHDAPLFLGSAPGLFSADRLDRGTELLLEQLVAVEPGERLLDLGCGIGPLGLAMLRRWPGSRAVLADADARAVNCARANAAHLGVADRCEVVWWDAGEPPPVTGCDRILLNPPFHRGKTVDLSLARALFATAAASLRGGGIALIVANRALPYETELQRHGRIKQLALGHGFKILAMTKPSPWT